VGYWSEGTRLCPMCARRIRDGDDYCSRGCEAAAEEERDRDEWLDELAPPEAA
jgi:predicted nucleic acid-binding Zn ribbon protein